MSSYHRRLPAIALAAAGVAALAGCEKPTPVATVVHGSDSVHTQAACYAHDEEDAVDERKCQPRGHPPEKIVVHAGDALGVGLDPASGATAWRVVVFDTARRGPVLEARFSGEQTYRRFQVPAEVLRFGTAELRVVAYVDGKARGVWFFQLERDPADKQLDWIQG
ncbi:hypothetical protein C3Y87_14910 [Carbonactinospora thermoautotrophica]|uniref:hypothetical protein n=1 Tax=Carbonactinospora thermoautotrophica TaxID=1469144 RepID=UPI00227049D5|nr:hypothetical protein [Carbonactinospora thermoautotrophica]MCX9192681.1 hypothetical protein [Carbonactinospora thermoautotrophica]